MTTAEPDPPAPVPGVVPARDRTVHLVTHPEASHHVDGMVGGQFDSDLTARGRTDAAGVAAELRRRIGGDRRVAVVTSDLRRTAITAGAIGTALGVAPTSDDRLRESSFGVAGGRDQAWLDARFVPPPAVGDRLDHHVGIDGAETRRDVARRVYRAMADALALDVDDLVVVTHGFAATFVVAAWIGMPVAAAGHVAFRVASGSISTLREDSSWHNRSVVALGDTGHLARPA